MDHNSPPQTLTTDYARIQWLEILDPCLARLNSGSIWEKISRIGFFFSSSSRAYFNSLAIQILDVTFWSVGSRVSSNLSLLPSHHAARHGTVDQAQVSVPLDTQHTMDFKTLFHIGLIRRARDNTDNTVKLQNPRIKSTAPRTKSKRVVSGLRKAFSIHRRHDSGVDSAARESDAIEPPAPSASQLFRLELPEQQAGVLNDSSVEVPRIEAKKAVKSDQSPLSTATYNTLTPQSSASSAIETAQTTTGFEALESDDMENSLLRSHELDVTVEYETAPAELGEAEKLLHQYHAAAEKEEANPNHKTSPLGAIVKMNNAKNNTRSALPPYMTSPAYRRQQPATAKEACEALQRRQLIKSLAFNGIYNIGDAALVLEQLKAHLILKAHNPLAPELILNFDDVQVRTNQLGAIERRWISRFFALQSTAHLVDCRSMSAADCDMITAQLFPNERGNLLKPEYFEIFMEGLGEEGILPLQEARRIARLGVTHEEFDNGARYTGPSCDARTHRYNASTLTMFDIPHSPTWTHSPNSPPRDLYFYLRILVEAAVYKQQVWKSHFFPNARSRLLSFYTAHHLSSQGHVLPAHLSPFVRAWSPRAVRLLHRGTLLCHFLSRHHTGNITDFGIIRATRAAFVHIPGQSVFSAEALESFLYHRVVGSGMAVGCIPQILALHPGNDVLCEDEERWAGVLAGLSDRAWGFEREEREREKERAGAVERFEAQRRAGMGRWERARWRWRWKAKGEVKRWFDPFAVEVEDASVHGS